MKDESGPTAENNAQTDESEGFMARWSRRKRETIDTPESASTPPPDPRAAPAVGEDIATAKAELTDADMPSIESLTEDSDYSVFLSPRVSEALRQQALQKLFRTTRFNVCDGLDDYAEDFTEFAGLGDIVTHEMRYMLERQKEKLAEALREAAHEAAPEEHGLVAQDDRDRQQGPAPPSEQAPAADRESGSPASPGNREDTLPS